MSKSKLLQGRPKLAKSVAHFEKWLLAHGYRAASTMYPGAVHAGDLIGDYTREYSDNSDFDALEDYANSLGWISDYEASDDDEDEPVDPDERW